MNCPRCGGRLLRDRDRHGEYAYCLACGQVIEPGVPALSIEQERAQAHAAGLRYVRGAMHSGVML